MNKIHTILAGALFAAATLFSLQASGQAYSFVTSKKVINRTQGTAHTKVSILIKNESAERLLLKWSLLANTFDASGWDYSFCDPRDCYLEIPDTSSFYLETGQTSEFKMDVGFDGKDGQGEFEVYLYNPAGPEVDTLYFEVSRGTSSIEEYNATAEVSSYPNPATDVLNINVAEGFVPVKAMVTSVTGQVVLTADLHKSANAQLNIAELPKGVYILNLVDNKGQAGISRFIKQ